MFDENDAYMLHIFTVEDHNGIAILLGEAIRQQDDIKRKRTDGSSDEKSSIEFFEIPSSVPSELPASLMRKVFNDHNLISIEKVKSKEILRPDAIPMFLADNDSESHIEGKFELVSNKTVYDEWTDCLIENKRKISVSGIIIGKFEDFKKVGYMLKSKTTPPKLRLKKNYEKTDLRKAVRQNPDIIWDLFTTINTKTPRYIKGQYVISKKRPRFGRKEEYDETPYFYLNFEDFGPCMEHLPPKNR